MKKKIGLHLVTSKSKEYEVVTIYTCDGTVHAFALNEYEMWESEEWVEFKKKDVLECFPIHNISHISFVNKGGTPIVLGPTLKPVA